jgi:hypothetical protein
MNQRTDGQMKMKRWTNGQMDRWIDVKIDRMNRWIDETMNELNI